MKPLRIALVAPPWYPVPPPGYGGIELVVHLLARELGARDHHVTLFGGEGSDSAPDVRVLAPGWWSGDLGTQLRRVRELTYARRVYRQIADGRFDIVHDHNEFAGMIVASSVRLPIPVVSTFHGALREPDLTFLLEVDKDLGLVAISEAQRASAPLIEWAGVVHNAVDSLHLDVGLKKDDYLLCLARITPDKGQHLAIEVARRAGRPLILAGKLEQTSKEYFFRDIEPRLGPDVRWIQDIGGQSKARLLARARALLFPIQWEEPFGLAMVEAMASGTPVVAFDRGAARELVEPGVTGYLVRGVDEMVEALERLDRIEPVTCAGRARERFGPARMADGYEEIYERVISRAR